MVVIIISMLVLYIVNKWTAQATKPNQTKMCPFDKCDHRINLDPDLERVRYLHTKKERKHTLSLEHFENVHFFLMKLVTVSYNPH